MSEKHLNISYYDAVITMSDVENSESATGPYEFSREFKLITQLKSWMAINPSYGCFWDCAYCIQHKDTFFNQGDYKKVNNVSNIEEVIGEIMSSSRITSKTPLTFYNYSDPFLPQNCSNLSKILLIANLLNFGTFSTSFIEVKSEVFLS